MKPIPVNVNCENELKYQVFPGKLSQVIGNLLVNAADAIRKQLDAEISLKALLKENELEITISDNGPGIPDDIQQKVFDPFFTTKEVGKGTGLGLALSKKFLGEMNGTLTFDSKPGETIFFIKICAN